MSIRFDNNVKEQILKIIMEILVPAGANQIFLLKIVKKRSGAIP
jgi:hypothetical protein